MERYCVHDPGYWNYLTSSKQPVLRSPHPAPAPSTLPTSLTLSPQIKVEPVSPTLDLCPFDPATDGVLLASIRSPSQMQITVHDSSLTRIPGFMGAPVGQPTLPLPLLTLAPMQNILTPEPQQLPHTWDVIPRKYAQDFVPIQR